MSYIQHTHPLQRRYLELTQDVIVSALCLMLFVGMGIKLYHLARSILGGTDFSLVIGDILFLLVLLELVRLLLIYLEEHRVSVATMVEVGIVSTLREVILRGALHIEWPQLLVVCMFILTLGIVLRYSGIEPARKGGIAERGRPVQLHEGGAETRRLSPTPARTGGERS